jgi:hypothetical protein
LKLEIVRTVWLPSNRAVTKQMFSILDRLTAGHAYCTWSLSKLVEGREVDLFSYGEFTKEDQ